MNLRLRKKGGRLEICCGSGMGACRCRTARTWDLHCMLRIRKHVALRAIIVQVKLLQIYQGAGVGTVAGGAPVGDGAGGGAPPC